jgi:hypothetical protein
MKYDHFINVLRKHQTPHIKAVAFPESCAPNKIPESFAALLPDIIELLETRIQQFCTKTHQILVLFGLQLGSMTVNSNIPLSQGRIINDQQPTNHLCCSLSYLVVQKNELQHIQSWHGAQTIMVDFTTGLVMDAQQYVSLLFSEPSTGITYGKLNSGKLARAWMKTKPCNRFGNSKAVPMALAA